MQCLPETSHLIIKPRSVADTLNEADLGARSFLQLLVRLNPRKLTSNILWALLLLQCMPGLTQEFTIPAISDLPRIDRQSPRPATAILRNSAFILKLKNHAPLGSGYVIIGDPALVPLQPLEKVSNR